MELKRARLFSPSRDVLISELKWQKSQRTITGIAHLEASLTMHGQPVPVVINADLEVIDGNRIIAAAVNLGWSKIWTVVASTLKEAADQIALNRAAKVEPGPLRMTFAEAIGKSDMLERLDRTSYLREMRKAGKSKAAGPGSWEDAIGKAVGLLSASTYKRARMVVHTLQDPTLSPHIRDAAIEAYTEMETSGSAERGYRMLSLAKNPPFAKTSAGKLSMGPDGLPVTPPPAPGSRGPRATELRIAWVRALGAQGASVDQIGDRLNLDRKAVLRLINRHEIHVPAAKVLRRQHGRERDHNKVVEVAIADLDALVWSLDTVDRERLTPERLAEWSAALHGYAVQIDRVSRRMREGNKASDN